MCLSSMDLAQPEAAGCCFCQGVVDEESHQICLGNVTRGVEIFLSLGAMAPGLPQHGSLSFLLKELTRVQHGVEGGGCCRV